ncbi:MAG: hypothetical protein JSW08_00665 [archaeon]|nr:MAG: hypothetical protein JSW08_00665 [archaeon]
MASEARLELSLKKAIGVDLDLLDEGLGKMVYVNVGSDSGARNFAGRLVKVGHKFAGFENCYATGGREVTSVMNAFRTTRGCEGRAVGEHYALDKERAVLSCLTDPAYLSRVEHGTTDFSDKMTGAAIPDHTLSTGAIAQFVPFSKIVAKIDEVRKE